MFGKENLINGAFGDLQQGASWYCIRKKAHSYLSKQKGDWAKKL